MTNLPNTQTSPTVSRLFDAIQLAIPNGNKRLEFGGSVGQTDELPHSYHRSWLDSPHDDGYSVHYYGDKHRLRGLQGYSCALDLTFPNPADMVKYTARLHHLAITHNGKLFWRYGLREFAGTLDNRTVYGYDSTRGVRTYGWDDSHLYHIHVSFNRRLITSHNLLRLVEAFRD